jgi:hypothetical protein
MPALLTVTARTLIFRHLVFGGRAMGGIFWRGVLAAANVCWYRKSPSMVEGYWDYCS